MPRDVRAVTRPDSLIGCFVFLLCGVAKTEVTPRLRRNTAHSTADAKEETVPAEYPSFTEPKLPSPPPDFVYVSAVTVQLTRGLATSR